MTACITVLRLTGGFARESLRLAWADAVEAEQVGLRESYDQHPRQERKGNISSRSAWGARQNIR